MLSTLAIATLCYVAPPMARPALRLAEPSMQLSKKVRSAAPRSRARRRSRVPIRTRNSRKSF